MKTLVNIVALFILCLFNYSYANNNLLTTQNIKFIKISLTYNKITLKEDGLFIDFNKEDPTVISITSIREKIKKCGAVHLFPDKATYHLFLKYLDKIKHNPKSFEEKTVTFIAKKIPYLFSMKSNNNEITFSIITQKYVKEFDGNIVEQEFFYTFENINGEIVLSKMNVAG